MPLSVRVRTNVATALLGPTPVIRATRIPG
jgi:hypothetical protein